MRTPGMLLAQLEASVAGPEVGISLAQLAVVSCAEPEAHGQGQLRVRVSGLELDIALRGNLKVIVGLAGHVATVPDPQAARETHPATPRRSPCRQVVTVSALRPPRPCVLLPVGPLHLSNPRTKNTRPPGPMTL